MGRGGGVVLRPSRPQVRAIAARPGALRWRGAGKGGRRCHYGGVGVQGKGTDAKAPCSGGRGGALVTVVRHCGCCGKEEEGAASGCYETGNEDQAKAVVGGMTFTLCGLKKTCCEVP